MTNGPRPSRMTIGIAVSGWTIIAVIAFIVAWHREPNHTVVIGWTVVSLIVVFIVTTLGQSKR